MYGCSANNMLFRLLECHRQGLIQWCDLEPTYKQTNANIHVIELRAHS